MSSNAQSLVLGRRRLVTGTVTCTALGLAFGLAVPAAASPAATDDRLAPIVATAPDATADDVAPVTVLQLTSPEGETTPIAQDGLADLAAEGQTPVPARAAGTTNFAAVGASLGAMPSIVEQSLGLTVATPGEVAPDTVQVLSAPLETDEFLVAGLTWEGDTTLPEGTEVFLRVLEDDAWSPWLPLEQEFTEKDSEAGDAPATGGTEPFVTGGATAVQVQVATTQNTELPADLQLNLVPAVAEGADRVLAEAPADTVTADGTVTEQPTPEEATRSLLTGATATPQGATGTEATASAALEGGAQPAGPAGTSPLTPAASQWLAGETELAAVARPSIISRSGWGADESKMTWRPNQNPIRAAVVHHTAGTNNYSRAQSAGVVRGIFHYHAVTRGWGDVGYNFLFDKYGQIFEGRAGSLWSPTGRIPTGAHASGYNTGTVGVSAMGDYSTVWAPQSTLDNMAKVIAWKFGGAGINGTSASGIIAPGTNFTSRGTNLPRIFGHRDVANVTRTTCPGPNIGRRLGAMRTSVDQIIAAGRATGGSASTPQTTKSDPVWYLNNNFDSSSDLQFTFGTRTDQRLVGDWDGDRTDTVGFRRGISFHLVNAHRNGDADEIVAFGRADDQVYVGDWNGDGKDTPAVRRGSRFFVQNDFRGGEAEYFVDFGRADDEVLVGDWNGDGKDTIAVRRGTQFLMRNSMSSGVADVVATYGRPGDVALVGDWNGDGKDTIGVRRGTEYHLRNVIADGVADITVNYGRTTDEHLVGDWNGDRVDTLGLRRLDP